MAKWGPTLDEKGIQQITYSDSDLSAFKDAVAGPAAEAWVADNAAKGLPAQELLDMVKGMVGSGS
jgi:hypothetical protein